MSVTAEQLQSAKEALQTAQGDRLRADRILSKDGWTDQVLRKRALDEAEANVSTDRESTPREVADAVTIEPQQQGEVAAEASKDAAGTFPHGATFFESIAMPLAQRGWRVAPCYPKQKQVHTRLVPRPLEMRSSDPAQIHAWGLAEPEANICVYAEQVIGGLLFLDKDGAVNLRERYERETGKPFPKTLLVRSSVIPGTGISKGHWYFYQTPKTIAARNINEHKTGELKFSLRVHNEYVASIGSIHPDTGLPYTIAEDFPVIPMPDELLEWLQKQVTDNPNPKTETGERRKLVVGTRYPALMSELGRLWNRGYDLDGLIAAGVAWARANFEVGPEGFDEDLVTREIEHYHKSYGDGEDKSVRVGSNARGAGQQPTQAATVDEDGPDVVIENGITYAIIPHGNGFRRVALDTSTVCARPMFPDWVMKGTSIYENLVRPAVQLSSKYPEFIFMPAMQAVMNYLSHNVTVDMQPTNMNLFLGLISPYGKFFKSTSCALAHEYVQEMGLLYERSDLKRDNVDGKIAVAQSGSSEGFGLLMKSLKAKNAILFNDELGKLVSKAGIEKSSFSSDLLSWYGSAAFENRVKDNLKSFCFPAKSYTFGWLWCTTDRNFNHYWPKLAGISSGIQDRMFFLVSPEKPRPIVPYRDPELATGAKKTRALVDRAVAQGRFRVVDFEYEKHVNGLDDPRSLDMLFKLALYFAVDLGLDSIDETCMERARALVDYRNQAAVFLQPIEAENAEGRLMQEIRRELRQNGGIMPYRELCRNMNADRAGRTWDLAYRLLKEAGTQAIVEFYAGQTPGKRKTRMVAIKIDDEDLPE